MELSPQEQGSLAGLVNSNNGIALCRRTSFGYRLVRSTPAPPSKRHDRATGRCVALKLLPIRSCANSLKAPLLPILSADSSSTYLWTANLHEELARPMRDNADDIHSGALSRSGKSS